MSFLRVFVLLTLVSTIQAQDSHPPLTQISACNLINRIVRIDTDVMHGSGVIIDPDGWIVTALHVVADQKTFVEYGNINVTVSGFRRPFPAQVASKIDQVASVRDLAILKIDRTKLPYIEIEDRKAEHPLGSPVAIIGIPISARFGSGGPIPTFCLSGTIAAQESFSLGGLNYIRRIYFQGVSIKGISGAPIILLESGKVIGIVSTKLTGISTGLDEARSRILATRNAGATIFLGVDLLQTLGGLIDTLDDQLANGLGGGSGSTDIALALVQAKQEYKRQKP